MCLRVRVYTCHYVCVSFLILLLYEPTCLFCIFFINNTSFTVVDISMRMTLNTNVMESWYTTDKSYSQEIAGSNNWLKHGQQWESNSLYIHFVLICI